jgi:hypothetical protein
MESTDRSLQSTAQNAANTAGTTGAGYGSDASSISKTLIPTLNYEATGQAGLTPTQKNQMLVAANQGSGGAAGGVAGTAGLRAGIAKNSGSLSGTLDAAARARTQAASEAGLNVENKSTDIANQKQAAALSQLQGLYGTDVSAQLKAMGLVAPDVNASTTAGNSGWLQNTMGVIGGLGGAAVNASKAGGFS